MDDVRLIDANALAEEFVGGECMKSMAEAIADKRFVKAIRQAPTIDAVQVVHGRWVHDINNLYGCSACLGRENMSHRKLKKYCPNCGAKMDEKEEDHG